MTESVPREKFADYTARKDLATLSWENDELALDLVSEFYSRFSNLLATGMRDSVAMILDVHLIDRVGFNAFAGSFAEADVIAIYRDVPVLLLKLARAMVSHGYILPNIKTAGVTVAPIIVPGTVRELLSAARVWEIAPLSDPLRENVAQQLARLAGQYVMAHEFAHIYNGHVDYLKAHLGLSLIAEIQAEGLPSPATFERETLEWDADTMALQSILQTATKPVVRDAGGRSTWAVPSCNEIGTRDEAIELTVIAPAICSIFFAESDKGDPRERGPRTHPHPLFRFSTIYDMILHVLVFKTGGDAQRVAPILEPTVASFLNSLAATIPRAMAPQSYYITDDEIGAALVARFKVWQESWAHMHPELDKLKRGGILAPAVQSTHPAFPLNSAVG